MLKLTDEEFATIKNRDTKKGKKVLAAPRITEHDVTLAVRQLLRTCGIWHFKHWGGPMGERGISDIIGCHQGRMIAIEIKKPGGVATPAQLAFLESVKKAGGIGFVASSTEDVVKVLGLEDRFLPMEKARGDKP